MLALLLIAVFTADAPKPTADNFNDYFSRVDKVRTAEIKKMTDRIAALEFDLKREPVRKIQGTMRGQLQATQKRLEQFNKTETVVRIQSTPGSIGVIGPSTVTSVIDDNTVLVRENDAFGAYFLLINVNAKEFKKRQVISPTTRWLVVSSNRKDVSDDIKRLATGALYEISPIPDEDFEPHRVLFETQKKAERGSVSIRLRNAWSSARSDFETFPGVSIASVNGLCSLRPSPTTGPLGSTAFVSGTVYFNR